MRNDFGGKTGLRYVKASKFEIKLKMCGIDGIFRCPGIELFKMLGLRLIRGMMQKYVVKDSV